LVEVGEPERLAEAKKLYCGMDRKRDCRIVDIEG